MNKGLSTIASEVVLTMISLSLAIPIIMFIHNLQDANSIEDYDTSILSCISYKYINTTSILIYNGCEFNINVYSVTGSLPNIDTILLYYNSTTGRFKETFALYAKGLHLLVTNRPIEKLVLNTSKGLVLLEK